jgi:hypothetical protein
MRATAALACALALSACSHSKIAGTNIDDSPAARAILDVFNKYRQALEARDPAGLLALAAPSYTDPGDAPHGVGPTEYSSLPDKLKKDFDHVTGVRLEATVKDLNVQGDKARLDYFQVLRYAVATPSGERWKSESDDARMKFVRVDGQWKIASGL